MMKKVSPNEVLFTSGSNINFQINVEEYGIELAPSPKTAIDLSQFSGVSEIYREVMSSTSISVGTFPLSDEKVAIKKIFKDDLKTDFQRRQAVQEFPLHCSLKHENIVKGLEWSEDDQEYVLLMEYMNNASYFQNKIDTNLTPVKNEAKLRSYLTDTLEGLSYLHSKGIVHGDIKLENILVNLNDDGKIPTAKLADFGLSRVQDKPHEKVYMEVAVGSCSYMAPEIKARSHVDEKIDIWALGVALYKMAVAYKPTQIAGYKYGSGPIPFRKFDWRKRSPELQDLVTQLLETDPARRISAEDALQHPWFQL